MDSVRYFEFDFVWNALSNLSIAQYLDVSSPRLFPIVLVLNKPEIVAELMNPDLSDLAATTNIVRALGLETRCNLHSYLITDAPFERSSFDVVTSISVVEHIPDDNQAIRKMWRLLKPGGRLLLTVPCASQTHEEYIDRNEYGLLESADDDFFFFQRYYDQQLLAKNIFVVTGYPSRVAVYGEKVAGTYHMNQQEKLANPHYPVWREPYTMGEGYQYFNTVDELPGIGVIAMEFVKR